MKKLKLLIILFAMMWNTTSIAQHYEGRGVAILDSIFADTSFNSAIHLKLTLVTFENGREESRQYLEFKKFGTKWNLDNSDLKIIGNAQVNVIINEKEKTVFLSDDDYSKMQVNPWKNYKIENPTLIYAKGSIVYFKTNSDTLFESIEYGIDTVRNSMVSVSINYRKQPGSKKAIKHVIEYNLVHRLTDAEELESAESYIVFKNKKAELVPSYGSYMFYDNRKKP